MIQRGFYVVEQDVTGYRVEANRVYTPKFTRDRMHRTVSAGLPQPAYGCACSRKT